MAILNTKRKRIVAACTDRFSRSQRIPIFDGHINRRLICRGNKRLDKNASGGIFDSNLFGIAQSGMPIDPLQCGLHWHAVSKALLSDISRRNSQPISRHKVSRRFPTSQTG